METFIVNFILAKTLVCFQGDGIMHIIDASNPMNLTYLNHVTTVNKELTDVVLCGDAIFVTYVDQTNLLQGGVLQFQLYSQRSGNVTYTRDIKSTLHSFIPVFVCYLAQRQFTRQDEKPLLISLREVKMSATG